MMNELMYSQSGRQRQQEIMHEAELERMAADVRRARKERPDHHWTSDVGWKLRRLGCRLLQILSPRKNTP